MRMLISCFLALLFWCALIATLPKAGAQQIDAQPASANVNGEAASSSVSGEDVVSAGANTVNTQSGRSGGPAKTSSSHAGAKMASKAHELSGSIHSFGHATEVRGKPTTGGNPGAASSSAFAKKLQPNSNSSGESSTGTGGGYPAEGRFPDSTMGTGVISPPMDYPVSNLGFKTGFVTWNPNFDSVVHLNPSYARTSSPSSSALPRRGIRSHQGRAIASHQAASMGSLLNGHALEDDLNRNALPGNSSGIDSGLLPDPLADQGDSITGSDQSK